MNSTQRSKSFKALSQAQPIRKDIENTLNMLELEKRKFLANEREEAFLKSEVDAKRREFNSIKSQTIQFMETKKTKKGEEMKVPTSVQAKNHQLKDADHTQEIVFGNIEKLKDEISTVRKRVTKLKGLNENLMVDQDKLVNEVEMYIEMIQVKEQSNEDIKNEIIGFRDNNLKNLTEFKKSHMNLTKSNMKDENERRKHSVSIKTFLGDETRQKFYQKSGDFLQQSAVVGPDGQKDILVNSLPIAKARVNLMIHRNKEKIRIAENYNKFGEGLENLFKTMKEYKGRDDVDYLSEEFVKKEKQIQKLGEYIGKLENHIVQHKKSLLIRNEIGIEKEKELEIERITESEKHYKELSKKTREEIETLKSDHLKMNAWMSNISEIICPLAGDNDFSRGNAMKVMGKLEEKLNIDRVNRSSDRKFLSGSPNKPGNGSFIEMNELEAQKYSELMSYEKMKEFADDFIKMKKN